MLTVKIIPNANGVPIGKLADAELHWSALSEADDETVSTTAAGGRALAALDVLDGLKLIGFGIWERRDGGRNVTFPARQYSVNGERRSFALLRPANGDTDAQMRVRDLILAAFDAYTAAIEAEPIESGPHAGAARDLSSFDYRA